MAICQYGNELRGFIDMLGKRTLRVRNNCPRRKITVGANTNSENPSPMGSVNLLLNSDIGVQKCKKLILLKKMAKKFWQ